MKRVGLVGGMSWQSTEIYYRLLNESVQARVGGHANATVTIHCVDFAEIEALQQLGDWPRSGEILAAAAVALQDGGVDAVAVAANTMHLVAGDVTAAIDVPFVDLIDVVARAADRYDRVGLLGTAYTMASDLYPKRLAPRGVDVLLPVADDAAVVHRIIYDELVHGVVRDESRATYLDVIARLVDQGAQAILLACTEIGLLLEDGDADVPLLDTARLHCEALTEFIITGELS